MPTATRIRDHCLAPGRAVHAPAPGGGYRRLFPELDPLDCVDDALHALGRAGGARHYRPDPGAAWIPLELADAAYRYGHSQVRDRYQVNGDAEPVPLLPDLLGFRPVPAVLVVDWSYLFDLPGRPPAQRAKRIDGRLAASLIRLPAAVTGIGSGDGYASLAIRDLQRGQGVGLPSGEALARRLGVEPLTPEEVGLGPAGWRLETPLWFYLLKEAEHRGGGERLGPVGGRRSPSWSPVPKRMSSRSVGNSRRRRSVSAAAQRRRRAKR